MKRVSTRVVLVLSFLVIALFAFNVTSAFAIGSTPEAKNMQLVGFNNLQARSAYQPIIQKQGDRWIAYIGLAIILYVALKMIHDGWIEVEPFIATCCLGR